MKAICLQVALLAAVLAVGQRAALGQPLDPTFTYQGRLTEDGHPANGIYNMEFNLYEDPDGMLWLDRYPDAGAAAVDVTSGLFTVIIEFDGAHFTGQKRWLELVIEAAPLLPLQELTPAAYSLFTLDTQKIAGRVVGSAAPGDGQVLKWDDAAAEWVPADDAGQTYTAGAGLTLIGSEFALDTDFTDALYWKLAGNAGTDPAIDFLGTTDDQPLIVKVNGERALRLEPAFDGDYGLVANLIGGYSGNQVTAGMVGATIGGGGYFMAPNSVTFHMGTVGGGLGNTAVGEADTIGGGADNTTGGGAATVAGGWSNTAGGGYAAVGGGVSNTAGDSYTTVGGGGNNTASRTGATVGGGGYNDAQATYATIAGGGPSDPGDPTNTNNRVTDDYGTIGGGGDNQVGDDDGDTTNATYATVGGGLSNTASALYSTVAGGNNNTASGWQTAIGGGSNNNANGVRGTIGGGENNTASSERTTVGGGLANDATNLCATVAGGWSNTASGPYAAVGGGYLNTATDQNSTVAGGYSNDATGNRATVPGGAHNTAAGSFSFAAGRRGQANHDGSFVWADSTDVDFASTGSNQFLIRASGGVGINTNAPGGFDLAVSGSAAKPGGGTWSVFSDARLKKNVEPLAGALERLLKLRGVTFEFKNPAFKLGLPGRQTGLIAQEVEQVFPEWVAEDADGYKYVTVRGLEALLVEALRELRQQHEAAAQALRAENAELRHQVSQLAERLERLEQAVR